MAAKWKAPKGFVSRKIAGYHMNSKGFKAASKDEERMPDGSIGVAHFDDAEPYKSDNSPNVTLKPIEDGWVPPVYTLHTEKEAPTHVED